jgi:hypothetical protein
MIDTPTPAPKPERKKRVTKHRKLGADGKPIRKKRERTVLMKIFQRVGFLLLLKRVRENRSVSAPLRKQWLVRCEGVISNDDGSTRICNNELQVPEMYLRRKTNPKMDCGCQTGSIKSRHNREYRIWLMVRERTRNASHIANAHYVSRGINICDEWYDIEKGFDLFFNEVGERPSTKHSIDRIDNVRGYEPGNIRWATSAQQRANQGDMVAGYLEKDIIKAGFTRREFTDYVSQGFDEHELISLGKVTFDRNLEEDYK